MRRKFKILFIVYIIIMAIVLFNTKDFTQLSTKLEYINCGTANKIPKPIPQLTTVAYTLLIVGTPIVLIAFSIVTLLKSISSGNADDVAKAKNNVIKKFITTALIFLTAALVQFVIIRVSNPADSDDKSSITNCIRCFLYYSGSSCIANTDVDNTPATHRRPYSNKSLGWNSNYSSSNKISGTSNTSTISSSGAKILYIGDSRTVGMCGYTGTEMYANKTCRDGVTVSKIGMGYSWFTSDGLLNANVILNSSTQKFNIVIWMGTNDIGSDATTAKNSAQSYATKIGELASGDWASHNIIVVPVTKVDEQKAKNSGYNITQANINEFNTQYKSSISALNKSNVYYCDISSLNPTTGADGLHYDTSGSDTVYNGIKNCLK